ncbi:MAG: ImmA/IrrE family metallo-endopeptidase [Hyphomonadaceae bacterium]
MAKSKLRRGFITQAEDMAAEFRSELGLSDSDPICPFALADHLAVPIRPILQDAGIPEEVRNYFSSEGQNKFSATTLFDGIYAEILLNDSHHRNRQHSSIVHELAHIILRHPARPPVREDGCRHFDPVLELEAKELGNIVLVPKPAALRAVENFVSHMEAARFFGVSPSLLTYRIRKSDAVRHAMARRRLQGR